MAKKQQRAAPALPDATIAPGAPSAGWFTRLVEQKRFLLVALLITVAVWLVYAQAGGFAFLTYEDSRVLTANPVVQAGWTWPGLQFAFQSYHDGVFYPVAWLSHMTDWAWSGPNAGPQHFTSVFIHLLNSLLLFSILASATGARWRSGLVALLFAVHPLQTESVAWLAERKTLLGGFFSLAAIAVWLRAPAARRDYYWAVAVLYALAVLSNPAVALIALIFPLLDIWPLGRRPRWGHALPLAVLGAAVLVFWAANTERALALHVSAETRLLNALAAVGEYLATVVWPANLAVPYLSRASVPPPLAAAGAAVIVLFTAAAFWRRTSSPCLLTGWLWFLVTLAPSLGVYPAMAASRADHSVYLALAGLFIALVWGLHAALGSLAESVPVTAATVLALSLLTWSAWVQAGYWQNDLALFNHTLQVTGPNRVAHSQIGTIYMQAQQTEYALNHLKTALDLDPNYAIGYRQLAEAYYSRKANDAALQMLDKAVALAPAESTVYLERGKVLRALNRNEEAYRSFEKAIQMGIPAGGRMDAYFNQGRIRDTENRPEEAIERYKMALDLDPYFYLARKNLAFALMHAGRSPEASAEFNLLARTNSQDEDVAKAIDYLKQQGRR